MKEIIHELINLAGFQASEASEYAERFPNDAIALVERIKQTIKKDGQKNLSRAL